MMRWLLLGGMLLLTGCMNITVNLQPENASVPALSMTSDCVPIILGFAYGNASVDGALANEAEHIHDWQKKAPRITKIRRVQLNDHQFLTFGARCVEVVGE